MRISKLYTLIGPGILVAATGVGAGDLATAAFTGNKLGMAVLWVVLIGAFFKFILNEGLTRWQLATGTTILEGAMYRLSQPLQYGFLIYFLVWSFLVAAALMSACGVAAHALFPFFDDPVQGKIIFGIIHSLSGVLIVRIGSYSLFEKIMKVCIAVMFVTVVITAFLLLREWESFFTGLLLPSIPEIGNEGLAWTVALMGGIGGTVTILCYGYWIREAGRYKSDDLITSRVDLAAAYLMTALFGIAMVVLGSTIHVEGKGATLIIRLAEKLGQELGQLGKWAFLIGAWGAIFSSLLGVWQSVPYLFADFIGLLRKLPGPPTAKIDIQSYTYKGYLYALATLPMIGLWAGFASMQKLYAISGALFLPMLAATLVVLNGSRKRIGRRFQNRPMTTVVLLIILLFFLLAGWLSISQI
jgi:Mn2+/Fe2+ NRAMP family transporter